MKPYGSKVAALHDSKVAALRRTKLFGAVDEQALEWLAARAREQHLGSGEMLFFSGEPAAGLFVVVAGTIRAFQQNAEGREQVMHIDTAGATLGDVPVFDDGPYPASAMAQEDAEILFLDKQVIRQFCLDNPEFSLMALKLMARRVRGHAQLVNILSFHEVGQRLAILLLAEAKKSGVADAEQVTFRLALSNHEIAAHIGSVRDVVSRALARLQHLGLVTVKARSITIPSVHALKNYVDSHEGRR